MIPTENKHEIEVKPAEIKAKVEFNDSNGPGLAIVIVFFASLIFCWYNIGPKLNALVDAMILYLQTH